METAIFRIIQESMTNVHRRSGSKTATVRLSLTPQEITIEIRDEGVGIPLGLSQGVGLRGMRERVRQFHGSLDVVSDNPGTRVTARFPVPEGDPSSGTVPFS